MKYLRTDNDRVRTALIYLRIPPPGCHSTKHRQYFKRRYPATPGDPVLAKSWKSKITRGHGTRRTDLRGLLPKAGRPQTQLALTL
jgi:hypothetical protein